MGRVSSEVGLKLPGGRGGVGDGSVDEYVDSFQAHMMPVVQAWCEGKPFVDVCKMTTIYEGEPYVCNFSLPCDCEASGFTSISFFPCIEH